MDSGVKGEELKYKILETLRDAGIDVSYCRGQGYDGAVNMPGVRCGCASLITAEYPLAIYMHCACRKRNLVIQKTCSVQMVRNTLSGKTSSGKFSSGKIFVTFPRRKFYPIVKIYVQQNNVTVLFSLFVLDLFALFI